MSMSDQIRARLADSEVRLTSGRREVLHVLTESPGPMSATEIDGALGGTVPLSSIYRTLAVLCETGIVAPHHGHITRYELAEPLQGHHHHLVCTDCGSIEDVQFGPAAECAVRDAVVEVGSAHGFSVRAHALEIEGTCRECS